MCGIVGIYLKNKKLSKDLGKYLTGMMEGMATRGPDSAGFDIYSDNKKSKEFKYSICLLNNLSFSNFKKIITKKFKKIKLNQHSDHVVITSEEDPKKLLSFISSELKDVSLVGYGLSLIHI